MESARCPRCTAAVPVGAPWCGLCYTDLRPAPASAGYDPLTAPLAAVEAVTGVPAELSVEASAGHALLRATPQPAPPAAFDPLDPLGRTQPGAAPQSSHPQPATGRATDPDDPAPRRSRRRAAGWPCTRCGAANEVTSDACAHCGAGFLEGVERTEIALPGLGLARGIERPQKVAIVVVATLAVTLVLTGFSIIAGMLL